MMIERLKNSVNNVKKYIPTKDSIKPHIEIIKKYANKLDKRTIENNFKENSVWVTIGLIVLVFLIAYLFFLPETNRLKSFQDIFLIATSAFGLPFLVWNYKNAYEQKETAKKSLQETQNNNRRTQDNKIYMDCITHLASDKETIRTASIHGFGELLSNLENDIKDLSETDTRKQEQINFQDKILNVLWSFMVEHSREVLKLTDDTTAKYIEAKEKINSLYHPQFRFIKELLAKYRPDVDTLYRLNNDSLKCPLKDTLIKFWKNKYWTNIYLQKIDLNGANLSRAYLYKANLRGAYLSGADLRGVDLGGAKLIQASLGYANLNKAVLGKANLSGAYLSEADLRDADLRDADLTDANFSCAKYNNTTIFPDGFDPTDHNMKYLNKPTEEAKQAEKSLESAE